VTVVGKLDYDVASRRLSATPTDVEDDVVAGVVVALRWFLLLLLVGVVVELKQRSRAGAAITAKKFGRAETNKKFSFKIILKRLIFD
jgi:hypothetical protein